jgi:hypothetical protein
MIHFDKQMVGLGQQGRMTEGTRVALDLIKLYDDFQCSSYFYSRVYSDLYQMSITKMKRSNKEWFSSNLPWILWVRIVAGEEEATQCASSD